MCLSDRYPPNNVAIYTNPKYVPYTKNANERLKFRNCVMNNVNMAPSP